jgi:hypothetical protein
LFFISGLEKSARLRELGVGVGWGIKVISKIAYSNQPDKVEASFKD